MSRDGISGLQFRLSHAARNLRRVTAVAAIIGGTMDGQDAGLGGGAGAPTTASFPSTGESLA